MVESGSLSEVASEISRAETVRFTEARTMSNAVPSSSLSSSGWTRLLTKRATGSGVMREMKREAFSAQRTAARAGRQEPKRSLLTPLLRASFTSVSVTVRAFFEKTRASTITPPAASRYQILACTGSASEPMRSVSSEPPAAT